MRTNHPNRYLSLPAPVSLERVPSSRFHTSSDANQMNEEYEIEFEANGRRKSILQLISIARLLVRSTSIAGSEYFFFTAEVLAIPTGALAKLTVRKHFKRRDYILQICDRARHIKIVGVFVIIPQVWAGGLASPASTASMKLWSPYARAVTDTFGPAYGTLLGLWKLHCRVVAGFPPSLVRCQGLLRSRRTDKHLLQCMRLDTRSSMDAEEVGRRSDSSFEKSQMNWDRRHLAQSVDADAVRSIVVEAARSIGVEAARYIGFEAARRIGIEVPVAASSDKSPGQ
ncbi:hypothetical protein K469DRAFT_686580 [Zopfia rhizophila CBS 207.26]|uniref:Uncharacterized protein n=1 Tax=Zopfia rhizophila CBS 207.26 TaxID=1314779 RepID=A0A6A6EUV8_9PEZI|nr:hypothetical protein K469DRAFT_686580 [Zopfia rhizophila CBS 207.26]